MYIPSTLAFKKSSPSDLSSESLAVPTSPIVWTVIISPFRSPFLARVSNSRDDRSKIENLDATNQESLKLFMNSYGIPKLEPARK
jgi:hypothetical protein